MGGLAQNLLNYGPVKVFADKKSDQDKAHDEKSSLDIERIAGINYLENIEKSGVVNEFIKNQNNIRALISDHWKSLEHLDKNIISKTKVICLIHSKEINFPINSFKTKEL